MLPIKGHLGLMLMRGVKGYFREPWLGFYFFCEPWIVSYFLRELWIDYPLLTFIFFVNRELDSFIISRGAEGPGREILQRPPSVCLSVCPSVRPSVTFSFRAVTQKRIDVFARNFAGTCTMSWGCAA